MTFQTFNIQALKLSFQASCQRERGREGRGGGSSRSARLCVCVCVLSSWLHLCNMSGDGESWCIPNRGRAVSVFCFQGSSLSFITDYDTWCGNFLMVNIGPVFMLKTKYFQTVFKKKNLEYADFTFPCASAITSRHISCPHQPSKAGSSLFWNQYIISKVRNPIWSQKIHKPGLCSESSWKKDSIKNLVVRDNKVPYFF